MNNNFVVSIPKELKEIEAKLIFGLTKRQLIGFGVALLTGGMVFFLLKDISLNAAMYGLFFVAMPSIFITIFKKNGIYGEKWLMLFIEYKFLYNHKRKYKLNKKNVALAKERNLINVKNANKKIEHISTPSANSRKQKTEND